MSSKIFKYYAIKKINFLLKKVRYKIIDRKTKEYNWSLVSLKTGKTKLLFELKVY